MRKVSTLLALAIALGANAPISARGEEATVDPFAAHRPLVLPVANYQPMTNTPFSDDGSEPVMPDRDPTTLEEIRTPPIPHPPSGYTPEKQVTRSGPKDMGWDIDEQGYSAKQYPDNWRWGCGGSPFRNGPGMCDDWKVGPVWDIAVDGMVLFREDANLTALTAATDMNSVGNSITPPQFFDQFDYGGGARVSLIGKIPRWAGYQIQGVYEGIPEWNASIVYPKQTDLDPVVPGQQLPFSGFSEQSTVHYRSQLHSGELNFMRTVNSVWRPYFGVRFIRFDDQVDYFQNQEVASPPLPIAGVNSVTETDMRNIFDIDNNLTGFQIGLREDLWRLNRRLYVEGFINSGVYYNRVKRSNLMTTSATQFIADNLSTLTINETRVDSSTASSQEVSEPTDIAYVAEASITGVCRLNRCCALRGGYQFLWIDGLQLAEDGFLGGGDGTRSLNFYGWHFGLEYRR